MDEDASDKLEKIGRALGLGALDYHVLLCADQDKPKCCRRQVGQESWEYLKNRLKELGLKRVFRTKVHCLRVCEQGPIAVVYPGGIWYHSVRPDVVERIIQEHLVGGRPVEEYIFARDPLGHAVE